MTIKKACLIWISMVLILLQLKSFGLTLNHIATTYLWEYRYLNYFFVRGTQEVLDWLIGLVQSTTYAHFDSIWLPIIPSANERQSIINALQAHHLIQCDDETGLIQVNPKGHEY